MLTRCNGFTGIHPKAVGYEGIKWLGVLDWIDYSVPGHPGPLKPKGIGRAADGRLVIGQIPEDCEWESLPKWWRPGGEEAIEEALGSCDAI